MAIINTTTKRRPISFVPKPGYPPSQVGNWIATDSRDLPWNTIGQALAASHGNGSTRDHLMTAAEVLDHTGLDIEVKKFPVKDADNGQAIPKLFVTGYDDPETKGRFWFGAVSDKYEPVRPATALGVFDHVVNQHAGSHYSAAWNMREKAMMGVTIEFPEEIVVDPQGANDRTGLHMLGINSFDGSTGLGGAVIATRWWCMNQLPATFKGIKRSFTFRHTKNVANRASEAAVALGIVKDYAAEFDRIANNLYTLTMTDRQFENFLGKLEPFALDGGETDLVEARVKARRDEALAAWRAPYNANITGTRWGAFNVAAEYIEWGRNVKGSARTGTSPTRQRAIGTLVHPSVSGLVNSALAVLTS